MSKEYTMDFLLDYRFWILAYLLLINLVGFALMGIDKSKAIRHKWRIPEKNAVFVRHIGRQRRRTNRHECLPA